MRKRIILLPSFCLLFAKAKIDKIMATFFFSKIFCEDQAKIKERKERER